MAERCIVATQRKLVERRGFAALGLVLAGLVFAWPLVEEHKLVVVAAQLVFVEQLIFVVPLAAVARSISFLRLIYSLPQCWLLVLSLACNTLVSSLYIV
jgi:hypothetical protein